MSMSKESKVQAQKCKNHEEKIANKKIANTKMANKKRKRKKERKVQPQKCKNNESNAMCIPQLSFSTNTWDWKRE